MPTYRKPTYREQQAAAIAYRDRIVADIAAMPEPAYDCIGGCGMKLHEPDQRCPICKNQRHTELVRSGRINP